MLKTTARSLAVPRCRLKVFVRLHNNLDTSPGSRCPQPHERHSTPLFCGEAGVGSALLATKIDVIFHGLIKYVLGGDEAEASLYSMHSWRRYLASAMMLADCTG